MGVVLLAGVALRLATFSATSPAALPTPRTARSARSASESKPSATASSAAAGLAPDGTFTTLDANTATVAALRGKAMTVAGLRGKPTLLWLLVTSCSSCVASAPAIAKALPSLQADGVQVVSLDLYGALPSTLQGFDQLAAWAAHNAGPAWSSTDWTWGMASEPLSLAYDPSGTPDLYVLIGPRGHLRYQDSLRSAGRVTTSAEFRCCRAPALTAASATVRRQRCRLRG